MPNLPHILIIMLACLLIGCGSPRQRGGGDQHGGYTETGQASYYADKFERRQTASGDLYRHHLKTAAHRTLPFGTRLRVTNRRNGKSVVVRVNDRGPFKRGRVVDLSRSAFKAIGDPSAGVLPVTIEVLP